MPHHSLGLRRGKRVRAQCHAGAWNGGTLPIAYGALGAGGGYDGEFSGRRRDNAIRGDLRWTF